MSSELDLWIALLFDPPVRELRELGAYGLMARRA